jgi:hypothetical protein
MRQMLLLVTGATSLLVAGGLLPGCGVEQPFNAGPDANTTFQCPDNSNELIGQCTEPGRDCTYPLNPNVCPSGDPCPGVGLNGWNCGATGCASPDGGDVCNSWSCTCDQSGSWGCSATECSKCTSACPCVPPMTGTPATCVTTLCDYGGSTTADCVCGQWVCSGPMCPPSLFGDAAPPCLDAGVDGAPDAMVGGSDGASDVADAFGD